MSATKRPIQEIVKNDIAARSLKPEEPPRAEGPEKNASIIFRIPEKKYSALKNYFEDSGLNLSAGIRMILFDYMKNKGIR